mmetsp:Transcript_10012/g.10117  ORF Transcript_10012/g.10117 Transcript_10012/m.10117 type:complete len:512 (-) Transcript_10012:77-1612(-)
MGGAVHLSADRLMNLYEIQEIIGYNNYNEKLYQMYLDTDGFVSTNKILELQQINYDIFISHDWEENDSLCKWMVIFCEDLKKNNIEAYFETDANSAINDAIRKSQLVGVCLTEKYKEKIQSSNDQDRCKLEFNYACQKQPLKSTMIPLLVEESMRDVSRWEGVVGQYLHEVKCIDCTEENKLKSSVEELVQRIREVVVPVREWQGTIVKEEKSSKHGIDMAACYERQKSVDSDTPLAMEEDDVGRYDGDCDEYGHKSGQGTYRYPNGDIYKGNWDGDSMHGTGTLITHAGDTYTGEFVCNKRHGAGTVKYANGDVYEGEYRENVKCGNGVMMHVSGERYSGEWKDGKRHGEGHCRFVSGDVYSGSYVEGRTEGKGTCTYHTGDVYSGFWRDGLYDGQGVFKGADGSIYEGEYVLGKRHGKGLYKAVNGDKYQGDWETDSMTGSGVLSYVSGEVYRGEMKNGLREGQGALTLVNNDVFTCNWKNDKKHGKGVHTTSDDREVVMEWRDDLLIS